MGDALVTKDTVTEYVLSNINNVQPYVVASVVAILVLVFLVLLYMFNFNIGKEVLKFITYIGHKLGYVVHKREKRYQRDVKVGKLDAKRRSVKIYRFLNDLIIDLELKKKGSTPYSFLCLIIIASILISLILTQTLFANMFMTIVFAPIVFAFILCILYTKANISHDARIEGVIEAENIISNNIKGGVVPAVRNSIDMIPKIVRTEFRDFLDNVEQKNYHISTALMELNNNLGSIADDFIKKCIEFETSEEHGISGMFKDVVEINNVKMEMRTIMKRKFEEVTTQFITGTLMIFVFLGGTIALFDVVREFYFTTLVGQLIICADILILVGEFVFITYLRAQDM